MIYETLRDYVIKPLAYGLFGDYETRDLVQSRIERFVNPNYSGLEEVVVR